MSGFDEWKRKSFPNTKAKDAWNEQQKKIDAVLKITNEYWLDDDRDHNVYIQRIEELLKCGKT